MLIWIIKIFGKVIGLDQIPKEKKEKAAEYALKFAEMGVKAYATGKADNLLFEMKKEF